METKKWYDPILKYIKKATDTVKEGFLDMKKKRADSTGGDKKSRKKIGLVKQILIGVMSMILTIVLMAGGWFLYNVYFFSDKSFLELVEDIDLDQTTTIYYYDNNGNAVELDQLFASDNRTWKTLDEIPQIVKDAAISVEDKRFYSHKGVDWRRTISAFAGMATGTNRGGGSTITQQFIKNITDDNAVKVDRKIREMYRALLLERHYKKGEILEYYLNTVSFGVRCEGVEAASNYYFDKSVENLTLLEAASIVGITNAPSLYDPFTHPDKNLERARLIVKLMLDNKKITKEEYEAAIAEEIKFVTENVDKRYSTKSYFVDQIIEDVSDDLVAQYGYSKSFAINMVYSKGLKIYSTMDKEIQDIIDKAYKDDSLFPKTKNKEGVKPQAAMIMLDPYTGDVVGMSGGRGEKEKDRTLNRATQSVRQPGSAIKPFAVYAPAVELGIWDPCAPINDGPIQPAGNWPKNSDNAYTGVCSWSEAIYRSKNTCAVNVFMALTPEKAYEFMTTKLGITTLDKSNDLNPSTALGGITYGISVLQVAAAYQIFPNGGVYNAPRTYSRVEGADDRVILIKSAQGEQAVSEASAYVVHQFLRDAVTKGTVSAGNPGNVDIAGKTGTTTANKDRWMVGYSNYYVCATWFGYDIPEELKGVEANPNRYIFKKVMRDVHAAKKKTKGFSIPSSVTKVTVCYYSGMPVSDNCHLDPEAKTITLYVDKSKAPKTKCDKHVRLVFCKESGCLAHENCPEESLVIKSLPIFDRRYSNANVTIADAGHVWFKVADNAILSLSSTMPAFSTQLPKGRYPAKISSGGKRYNTFCKVHEQPDVGRLVPTSKVPVVVPPEEPEEPEQHG